LALDLSLTHTGWCRSGETGCIRSKTRGWERVSKIVNTLDSLWFGAGLVVIEGYAFGARGGSVFDIAELGGIVRWELLLADIPFVDVPPSTLKKYATGKGNAGKDEMIAAAIRRFGFAGSDNNEADAYLLWCMARHAYGSPVVRVPQAQSECLGKVAWPDLRKDGDTP